jgi:hypothetical protein
VQVSIVAGRHTFTSSRFLEASAVSNQTFLYSTDTPDKPLYGQCPDDGHLLMAAMSIPVFWYMLYDKKSLKLGPVHDDPKRSYFHLTALTSDALLRAESRWPAVSHVLGRGVEPLVRTWVNFVRRHAKAYIHCETAEWYWMFNSHDSFTDELRLCLDAFKHVPKLRRRAVALNKWWDRLLGQAHVSEMDGHLRPLGNNSYCGFAYAYEVPWSLDEQEGCGVLKKELRDAPAFGKEPADIRGYLDRWGGIDEFRVSKCQCGSELFFFKYNSAAAQRVCASCGTDQFICDSEEVWADEEPKEWRCEACGSKVANLGVGFRVALNGGIRWLSIGQRCGKCGRLGCCVGWETRGCLELFDQA